MEIAKIGTRKRTNVNSGEFKIFGIQSNVYYKTKNFQATINYSYTYPRQTKDTTGNINLIVADIAAHKANLIANYSFLKQHCNINFRLNYVGGKKAGQGTTANASDINLFSGYILGNLALSVNDIFNVKGSVIQLVCNNVFGKIYYSPGIVVEGGNDYPGSVLQMKRNFAVRIMYSF